MDIITEDPFLTFYNSLKDNKLLKNYFFLEEPNVKEKYFMVEFKRYNSHLKIIDIYNPKNEFIFNSLCIQYENKDKISYHILGLYNGDFFMEDLKDILYPKKYFNDVNIKDQILKVYKVIEYFDYLVRYNDGKKIVDWYDWKDWNDYNF